MEKIIQRPSCDSINKRKVSHPTHWVPFPPRLPLKNRGSLAQGNQGLILSCGCLLPFVASVAISHSWAHTSLLKFCLLAALDPLWVGKPPWGHTKLVRTA